MPETFTRWDVTEHLGTEEDARLYLEACAEEDPGDGSLIRAALNDIAPPQNMTRLAHEERKPSYPNSSLEHGRCGRRKWRILNA